MRIATRAAALVAPSCRPDDVRNQGRGPGCDRDQGGRPGCSPHRGGKFRENLPIVFPVPIRVAYLPSAEVPLSVSFDFRRSLYGWPSTNAFANV